MKYRRIAAIALLVGLSACCAEEEVARPVDVSGLEEIRVDYHYMGWLFFDEQFTIRPADRPGIFVLRGRYETENGDTVEVETQVSSESVADFVRQSTLPTWGRERGVRALAQRVSQRSLRSFEPVLRSPASRCTDQELQQLAKPYFGRSGLVGLIDEHYGHGISWTDDYPHALVQMRWRGKPAFVMTSQSQKALMLPWDLGVPVDSPPETEQNWSLPLSASLQALLPPQSRTYERLGGLPDMELRLNWNAMHKAERRCDGLRPRLKASASPST